jgi:hypothetical protein
MPQELKPGVIPIPYRAKYQFSGIAGSQEDF